MIVRIERRKGNDPRYARVFDVSTGEDISRRIPIEHAPRLLAAGPGEEVEIDALKLRDGHPYLDAERQLVRERLTLVVA